MDAAKRNEPQTLDLQARLCEIPAPPFQEDGPRTGVEAPVRGTGPARRAHRRRGQRDRRAAGQGGAGPTWSSAAHLDTVFPEGTNVKVTREGERDESSGHRRRLPRPRRHAGGDPRAERAHVETPGTITFVADVGEEGLGDLRGMKSLFFDSLKGQIDKFISVDGTGLGITHIGVGSNRYKVTFKGPGGHSYGAFGMANPIQAMGRAIAKIDAIEVPRQPKTTFNVGRVGGGTSVNAIPFEAWMEVDMRSADPAALKEVDTRVPRRRQAGRRGGERALEQPRPGDARPPNWWACGPAGRPRRKARSCRPRWRSRAPCRSKRCCAKAPPMIRGGASRGRLTAR